MADQAGQGVHGRLGVGSVGLQFELGAVHGGERRQVEDAPAVHLAAIAGDPDLGPELLGQSHEFVGGPEMEAKGVGDLGLSADLEQGASFAVVGWGGGPA